ncbi:MAG: LL-diaminopimelate aminotransferase, partial [candidate division WOR-3 bacterium]
MKEIRARRLLRIPPYLFAELDALKAKTRGNVIDFGVGDPDLPTPSPIVRAMNRALEVPANHRYPTYAGKLAVRAAVVVAVGAGFG